MSKSRVNAVLCAAVAASVAGPQTFHTTARFTVDTRALVLQTAVAADDVGSLSGGGRVPGAGCAVLPKR